MSEMQYFKCTMCLWGPCLKVHKYNEHDVGCLRGGKQETWWQDVTKEARMADELQSNELQSNELQNEVDKINARVSARVPNMGSKGVKNDKNKIRWSLLPFKAVEEILKVLEYGAEKYSSDNWKMVPNRKERYFNAAMRHLVAWHGGEQCDTESGFNHLAHAGCCILFLLWGDK